VANSRLEHVANLLRQACQEGCGGGQYGCDCGDRGSPRSPSCQIWIRRGFGTFDQVYCAPHRWHSLSKIIDCQIQENDDVCASCSGAGRFLCCERCPRSFHFTCLNPPLEDVPEGMWFCNMCQAQMNPPPKEPRGLFSQLFDNLNRRNVTAFKLPAGIRNYFVGVETGVLGEYVDTRDAKTQKYRFAYPASTHVQDLMLMPMCFAARVDSPKSTILASSKTRMEHPFSVTIAVNPP
jgi:hypothetical protein